MSEQQRHIINVLKLYLKRGEAVLTDIRCGKLEKALFNFRLREATFANFRQLEKSSNANLVELYKDKKIRRLLYKVQKQNKTLKSQMSLYSIASVVNAAEMDNGRKLSSARRFFKKSA